MTLQSRWPADIKDRIVEALTMSTVARACAMDGMPDRATVARWMADDPDFAARCARARDQYADAQFDDLERIETDVEHGILDPQVAKVVISARQWRLSKLKPRAYGDRVEQVHSGGVEITKIERTIVRPGGGAEA